MEAKLVRKVAPACAQSGAREGEEGRGTSEKGSDKKLVHGSEAG